MSAVTVSVNALAGRGLVRRVADPGDLRRKLLVITDDGTQLLAERLEAGLGTSPARSLTGSATPSAHGCHKPFR